MGFSARSIRAWAAGPVVALGCGIARAAEHAAEAAEHAGDRGEQSLFAGDFGNVFWTVLIFVGLLFVLGKYAWRPMLEALNRREQFIRETVEGARRERAEAEKMLAEYRQMIARSRQEAQAIIDQGRQDAETMRQRLHEQARKESEQMIERARQEIALTKQSALQELQTVAADLSVDVARKIIQRNLSVSDQQRLVEESLKQLARGNGGARAD